MSKASRLGFLLEDIIHHYVQSIPGIIAIRETEIKKLIDNSINGVDHWFICGKKHVFVQDKWTSQVCQQEMAQFVTCVNRIIKTEKIFKNSDPANRMLILATKSIPTANTIRLLNDCNVKILQENNMNTLALQCTDEVSKYFGLKHSVGDKLPIVKHIELLEKIKVTLTPNENEMFIKSISATSSANTASTASEFDMHSFTEKIQK